MISKLFVIAAAAMIASPAAAQQGPQRVQVFSESFSMAAHGPYFLRLDSGVTYRLVTEGAAATDVTITPRVASAAPIRFSASTVTGNGSPFEAPVSAEYRIESTYSGRDVIQIRIWRERRDASECADPNRPGCALSVADGPQVHHKLSPAVLVMMGLLPAFLFGIFRNGKSL